MPLSQLTPLFSRSTQKTLKFTLETYRIFHKKFLREALKKWHCLGIFPKQGGWPGKLYVKYWWALFFCLENPILFWLKVKFLFINVPRGGGDSTGLGIIPKRYQFLQCFPHRTSRTMLGVHILGPKRSKFAQATEHNLGGRMGPKLPQNHPQYSAINLVWDALQIFIF